MLAAGVSIWSTLSLDDIMGLRAVVLEAGVYHAQRQPPFVVNQAATVYAAFTKRGWINYVAPDTASPPELLQLKESMHSDVLRLLNSGDESSNSENGPNGAAGNGETGENVLKTKLFGLAVVEALVSEFECARKASSMDVGAESHTECFTRFEMADLGVLFTNILSTLMEDTSASPELLSSALKLCTRILTWPFGQIWSILGIQFVSNTQSTPCRPPPHWRDFLITPNMEVLSLYSSVYSTARAADKHLAHVVCEGLMQLASLSGDIFGSREEERASIKPSWVGSFVHVLQSVLKIEGLSNVEMRDIALINQRFLGCTTLNNLLEAIGEESTKNFLADVTNRTCETMDRLAALASVGGTHFDGVDAADHFEDNEVEDTVIGEALDTWLQAWAGWSFDANILVPFPPLQEFMFRIFSSYVASRLVIAKAELLKDPGWIESDAGANIESKRDLKNPVIMEQLTNITAIGRTCPRVSIEFLKSMLMECYEALKQAVETCDLSSEAESRLEEMHWLLMIIGHFLCSISAGELASIPIALNRVCNSFDERGEPNAVVELITQVFEVVTLENNAIAQSSAGGVLVWSPLVAETLAWFLAHWASCYLLLSENSAVSAATSLNAQYGQCSETAHAILDALLHKIVVNLTSWSGETAVLVETCTILQLISRLDTLNMGLLIKLEGWTELYGAWTSNHSTMMTFPPKVQRRLMMALSNIVQADGVHNQVEYLTALSQPIDDSLSACIHAADFTTNYQNPPVMLSLQVSLERIRGLFKSTRGRTFKAINTIGVRYLSTLIDLLLLYKEHHAMVLLILKILADYVAFVLACTYEESNMVDFHNAMAHLFGSTAASGLFRRKTTRIGVTALGSRYGDEDARQEQVDELLQMLRILCGMVSNEGEDPARLSFEGLAVVVAPHLDAELLAYPALSKHYFQFISSIFSEHAMHLSMMDDSLFEIILRGLETGLHSTDDYIQMAALDAVAKIASFNFKLMTQKNIDVLQSKHALLGAWAEVLLRWIIFDDGFKVDLMGSASLTCFGIICCEYDAYGQIVHNLIAEQPDPAIQERLGNLFDALTQGVELEWTRASKEAFFQNFGQFVPVVRGMLHRR